MAFTGSGYIDPNVTAFGGFPGGINQTPAGVVYPINPVLPGVIATPIPVLAPASTITASGSIVTPLSSTIIDPTSNFMATTNYAPGI
ncbi:hypothetical protein I4U23_003659 [Adineta vaga]|nr:hypothetical protein I4U23_003659 [Adineta vaga]